MYVKRSEIALILTDLWLRLPVSSSSLYMGITSAVFHMVGIINVAVSASNGDSYEEIISVWAGFDSFGATSSGPQSVLD